MVTLEEKMKLAKELEMHGFTNYLEMQQEIKQLTALKLKAVTIPEIEKKLRCFYWAGIRDQVRREIDRNIPRGILLGAIGITGAISLLCPETRGSWRVILPVCLTLSALVYGLFGIEEADIESMELWQWSDNLPYGALLAIQEVKARGFNSFRIFYPEKQGRTHLRILRDPMIVAEKKGVRMEVFSWDDGKVYE